MSQTPSSSSAEDALLERFVQDYHDASDKGAALAAFVVAHPDRADEARELAALQQKLGGPDGAAAEPWPEQLPDFEIVRQLDSGGMGVVYEAKQLSLGRRVALKVRRRSLSPTSHLRFLREQHALARLHQTHIVPVHTAGQVGSWQYYAMKYIEGAPLHRLLRLTLRRETSQGGCAPELLFQAPQKWLIRRMRVLVAGSSWLVRYDAFLSSNAPGKRTFLPETLLVVEVREVRFATPWHTLGWRPGNEWPRSPLLLLFARRTTAFQAGSTARNGTEPRPADADPSKRTGEPLSTGRKDAHFPHEPNFRPSSGGRWQRKRASACSPRAGTKADRLADCRV